MKKPPLRYWLPMNGNAADNVSLVFLAALLLTPLAMQAAAYHVDARSLTATS